MQEVKENARGPADLLGDRAKATLTVLDAELGDLGAPVIIPMIDPVSGWSRAGCQC